MTIGLQHSSKNGLIHINSRLIFVIRGHTDAVLCLQFDDHKLVSGSKDTTIKVCDSTLLLMLCTCW